MKNTLLDIFQISMDCFSEHNVSEPLQKWQWFEKNILWTVHVSTTTMSRGSYHKSSSSRHSKHFDEKKKKVVEAPTVSDPGLLNRTAWTNAAVALVHIKKVRKCVCKHRPLIETSQSAILDLAGTCPVPPRHLLQHILPPPPSYLWHLRHNNRLPRCSLSPDCPQKFNSRVCGFLFLCISACMRGLCCLILRPRIELSSCLGARWLYYSNRS